MKKDYSLKDITPERIATATVSAEFFGLMLRKLAEQHNDKSSPVDPYLAAFFSYVEINNIAPGSGSSLSLKDQLTISAASHRFFALGNLEKDGHLKNWSKIRDDHVMLHPALIESACKSQLLVKGEEFYFQPIEFLNHALNVASVNSPF